MTRTHIASQSSFFGTIVSFQTLAGQFQAVIVQATRPSRSRVSSTQPLSRRGSKNFENQFFYDRQRTGRRREVILPGIIARLLPLLLLCLAYSNDAGAQSPDRSPGLNLG